MDEINLVTFGVFKTLAEVALASGALLGITALIGKVTPSTLHDRVLPVLACVLGVGIAFAFQASHGDAPTLVGGLVGVVFGGSVTGLYAVAKDMKKTPNVLVNQ